MKERDMEPGRAESGEDGLLHEMVRSAAVVLMAIDREGVIVRLEGGDTSPAPPCALVGAHVRSFHPEYAAWVEAVEAALRGEAGATLRLDVAGEAYEVRVRAMHDGEGAVSGVVSTAFNISAQRNVERERVRLQAQMLRMQKHESLGVLAGGIAHEFNNLLTAMLGNAAFAMMDLDEASPTHAVIAEIADAAQRAAQLTRQMLAYAGKGRVEVRRVDLSALVREISELLRAAVPKTVQLRLELERDLPTIAADVAQVQQVVMNLVVNGAEAIGEEVGTVLVTTGALDVSQEYAHELFPEQAMGAGRYVFLEVHDTGSGIPDDVRERIFEPFFSSKFAGRGLGLSAVQGIVQSHHGAVKVYSTVGRGSTFKVLIPSCEASADTGSSAPPPPPAVSGVVLIVDDEPAVRAVTGRLLRRLGFDVAEAVNGRDAVEYMRAHVGEVALVLLDVTMPVMSGEEAYREIRQIAPGLKVILTSGYNEVEATRRFASKGLAGFLQKPFSAQQLEALLTRTFAPA